MAGRRHVGGWQVSSPHLTGGKWVCSPPPDDLAAVARLLAGAPPSEVEDVGAVRHRVRALECSIGQVCIRGQSGEAAGRV